MSVQVEWSERATNQLRDIVPWEDAAWIASEVERYASDGIGDVRKLALASGQIAPVLFLPGYRVVFAYDRTTKTLWVRLVLHASKRLSSSHILHAGLDRNARRIVIVCRSIGRPLRNGFTVTNERIANVSREPRSRSLLRHSTMRTTRQ